MVTEHVCDVDGLKHYNRSSYPKFWKQTVRTGLDRKRLTALLGVGDSIAGMRQYREHLRNCEAGDLELQERLKKRYCRGWFIGSAKARKELAEELVKQHSDVDWELADYHELKIAKWEGIVIEEMSRRGKDEEARISDPKAAPWKAEIAIRLRKETTAPNPWIADRLHMGHPSRVSTIIRNAKDV